MNRDTSWKSLDRLPLIISIIALVVSIGSAWFTVFRPAHIIGDLSYVTLWRLSSNNDGVVTDTVVAPAFWLRNVGARSIVISDCASCSCQATVRATRLIQSPPCREKPSTAHPNSMSTGDCRW